MAEHKIILASVAPGSEGAVTAALVKALGSGEAAVKQIVSSVPIILIDGLEAGQAQAVATAMSSVKTAGGNLVISAAPGQAMPHVDWPVPPKVGGRDVASFGAGAGRARPSTGAHRAATPAGAAARASGVSATTITCPHCGKPMVLQASAVGAGTGGIRRVPVPQAPQAGRQPDGIDNVGKALPEVPNVKGRVETPPPAGGVLTSPMDLEEFERGVGGGGPMQHVGDSLLQQLDKALEEPGAKPPSPKPKAKQPPSPSAGRQPRGRPRSPGAAAERGRGRDRKRRR